MPNQREKTDERDFFFNLCVFPFFFLAPAPGLQDPSSPARDWTRARGSEIVES